MMKQNMIQTKKYLAAIAVMLICCVISSCEKEEYELIKYYKLTEGPIIVGEPVVFKFAIASNNESSLNTWEITASYAGQEGTFIDDKVYNTTRDGVTHNMVMLSEIAVSGKKISGLVVDGVEWAVGNIPGYSSKAVTLTYTYVPSAEARGKKLQFDVRYTTKQGSVQSYSTIGYDVSNMDMAKTIVLADPADGTGKRYFSISEMKSYTLAEVEAQNKSAVIDFVYRYNPSAMTSSGGTNVTLNHAISSPSHSFYLDANYVPANWTKNASPVEIRKWEDMQLKLSQPSVFVTDKELESITFTKNSFGVYALTVGFGVVVQTADGNYNAFVYVRAVNNAARTMTIGVKRLAI
jgi:hypothetical protein